MPSRATFSPETQDISQASQASLASQSRRCFSVAEANAPVTRKGNSCSGELSPHARSARAVEKDFEQYLSLERGLSHATVVNYLPFVHQFLLERFASDRIRLSKLCAADITDFVQRHAHDFSFGRTKLMVTALRSFLRHLRHRGEIATDLAACVPCVANWSFASLPKFLLPGQVQQVLEHCDRRTESGKRDYAILSLLARLGLRAGEVVALTLDDIDWEAGLLAVRSKGGRWTQLPLPSDVGEALACYLQHGTQQFFVIAKGHRDAMLIDVEPREDLVVTRNKLSDLRLN